MFRKDWELVVNGEPTIKTFYYITVSLGKNDDSPKSVRLYSVGGCTSEADPFFKSDS